MTSLFVNGGIALLAAMVHATLSLSLVWLAFRTFRIAPVSREWMLRAALVLPLVMAGRSLAGVVPGEARIRAAFAQLAADDSGLQPHLGGITGEAFRVVRVVDSNEGEMRSGFVGGPSGPSVRGPGIGREAGSMRRETMERNVTLVPGRAAWVGWVLWISGAVWLLWMVVHLARAFRSAITVRRLVAGSLPAPVGLAAEVQALGHSGGVGRLRVHIVEGLGSPFAALGGRLILPDWIERIPRAERHAILAHEIAHLRRRDPLLQALLVPVHAALWPHPLLRWALLEMRQAVEHRCDDAAIESTDRMTLARALAEVAERLHASHALPATGHLAVSGAPISDRIGRALTGDREGRVWIAATCGAFLIALTLMLPPTEPGPEYHLQVTQSHQIIEDGVVDNLIDSDGTASPESYPAAPLSDF